MNKYLKKAASEKGIIIVDFDDTISDAGHRKHHVEVKDGSPNFQKFNQQAHHDTPNMDVIMKLRQMSKDGNEIVIMTGRSEMVRSQAIQWLQKHNVPYNKLIMRPASSRMKSHELKQLWLKDIDKDRVIAAIDDNPQNINMFKSHGIKTHRVRDGKIEGQIMSNKYLNKALEKAAAKTLDEIDDDRRTSKRRASYLPGIGTAVGAGGVVGHALAKKTGRNIVLDKGGKIGPQRGWHVIKKTRTLPPNLGRNALVAAGIGGVAGNYLKNIINDAQEEKFRSQRTERRRELRAMREKKRSQG